jgi:hypothetical protein
MGDLTKNLSRHEFASMSLGQIGVVSTTKQCRNSTILTIYRIHLKLSICSVVPLILSYLIVTLVRRSTLSVWLIT